MVANAPLRFFKLKQLPIVTAEDAMYVIKQDGETTAQLYFTTAQGVPFPVGTIDPGATLQPMVNGAIPPQLMYFDDGNLLYVEV